MNSTPEAPHLPRALGIRDVALFMVTAGCSVQWFTTAAAAGPSSLLVWVFGGLTMFLPLSVCVVFLSSRYPDEGGLYVWSKHAWGDPDSRRAAHGRRDGTDRSGDDAGRDRARVRATCG
jgi:amino acid transporter